MFLNIKKAYPEIVRAANVVRLRRDHLSYEFVAEIVLVDGSVCHVKDYLFMDGTRKYSYHWQNEHGALIARWDNAPHWPGIDFSITCMSWIPSMPLLHLSDRCKMSWTQ